MKMLLRPRATADDLFDIPLARLKGQGIRGIIFDLDNTIIAWGSPALQPDVIDWFRRQVLPDFKVCLLSNNMTRRVGDIAAFLSVPCVSRACKPAKSGFRRALVRLALPPGQVAVVGDQLFTDILGGNRLGLYTVWVAPLSTNEFAGTKITRRLEKLAARLLRLKR